MKYVALLGFGVVGGGTAEVLTRNQALIEARVGEPVRIKYILDLREFPDSPFRDLIVHDFNIILNDPAVSVVAEMMGGAHPAYDFTKALLEAGKSVVTSNKQVVASFGTELLAVARAHGVSYLFEASVGGGIPIIRPLREDLAQNHILSVSGILNGTTNYILTEMETKGTPFADVLRDAQEKGYAEKDPTADIEGLDAARKTVILASMAFGRLLDPDSIPCEGITRITADDAALARAMGGAVKLIGHACADPQTGRILAMVSPRFVPGGNPLAGVSGVFNGILVRADMVGEVMFYGPGAGKLPTASAVVSDIMEAAHADPAAAPQWSNADRETAADFDACSCRSLLVFDAPADAADSLASRFGGAEDVRCAPGRLSFLTPALSEKDTADRIAAAGFPLVSRLRVLD
jgi:homoserine dehydrogenase